MLNLININLENKNLYDEEVKMLEEFNAFTNMLLDLDLQKDNSYEHACEELYDVLQAGIGCITKKYCKKAEDIQKEYYKHIKKLKSRNFRPRD